MKKLYFFSLTLSLLVLLSCCSKTNETSPLQIHKIMSFNIRYGTAEDGENAWPKRKNFLFEVIKNYYPDILGVQEALDFQLTELINNFQHYKKSGVGRNDGLNDGEHSAIFFDSNRYDMIQEETFWFSNTPHKPGSLSWDAHFPRICSWIELADKASGRHIFVFNNHWDHESQLSRDNSADMLINKIIELKISAYPIVIMGDFNAGESNPAFRHLTTSESVKLTDTFRMLKPSAVNVGTFNAFKGITDGEKIDAILVSAAFKVHAANIIRTDKNGFYPSDHFPVTAELIIK